MAQINDDKDHKGAKNARFCSQLKQFLLAMFLYLRYWVDVSIDTVFGLYHKDNPPVKVAEPKNPLVLQSATSLARKIRSGEVKSEQVVRAFVERIEEINSAINAVVDERFEAAIKEAQSLDYDIQTGSVIDCDFQIKPFLGVPFTTKESTACREMSFSFGLLSRKGRKSNFDAEVVERVKKAGGILLAVTNIPQLNLWQETNNPVYGVTSNPYNLSRNVGGSSGGEAALIAAAGSPFGIGSDIGGSLRIPAFMCGIYGHKPSPNLVSTNGLTFRTGKETDTMVTAGPMTKSAEDLAPFLKILIGKNSDKLKLDVKINVFDCVKVYYVVDPHDNFVSPSRDYMKDILLRVVDFFKGASRVAPQEICFKEMKYGGKIWRYWMSQEPDANFNRDVADRRGEINSLMEIGKFVLGLSEFGGSVIFNLVNGLLPSEKKQWAEETTRLLRFKLINLLGSDGVLLYPSAPWAASYHNAAFLRPWNFNLFAIWNALKFPVTQVPLGLNKEGLPIGIQVVAAPNNDHLTIAVAKELEKAFGGYVPPFKTNN